MKTKKQNADFVHVGAQLLAWYKTNGRPLPFRKTKDPYTIWISEIIFQQTRIEQGLGHYSRFIERFPDVNALANADSDEVLLYWKGLGYYSRALNLHKAAQKIVNAYGGVFPSQLSHILQLNGVGHYTAAAIASICYEERIPAVDGNFYRVLSRFFADDYDISQSKAFRYFSELAMRMMPNDAPGHFNQAMMDLGSEICKPKNPQCGVCPLNEECMSFATGKMLDFPVKTKKVKITDLSLTYFFVEYGDQFLIRQRSDDFIWKKLYEFPAEVPPLFLAHCTHETRIRHQLTHKNLTIHVSRITLDSEKEFLDFATAYGFMISDLEHAKNRSFPKPLEHYLERL